MIQSHLRWAFKLSLGCMLLIIFGWAAAEAGVSRHHARLTRHGDGWHIDDLGSLNGTYVNDVKINPGQPVLLKDGDLIRCSHLTFLFLVTPKS